MARLDWDAATRLLAGAGDRRTLRERLLSLADRLGPEIRGMGVSHRAWRSLGLRVSARELGELSGLTSLSSGERVVQLNKQDDPRRQRFTVAHELAHLLMADVDRAAIALARRQEEALADEFARRLLVPRADLSALLATLDQDFRALFAICRRYDVSIAVALSVAGDWLASGGRAMFAASCRAHPARPEQVALRAHGARCGELLIPDLIRLDSLGLAEISAALEAGCGDPSQGETDQLQLPLWRPGGLPRSGVARGPAHWRSETTKSGVTLVQLDTCGLRRTWWGSSQAREGLSVAA